MSEEKSRDILTAVAVGVGKALGSANRRIRGIKRGLKPEPPPKGRGSVTVERGVTAEGKKKSKKEAPERRGTTKRKSGMAGGSRHTTGKKSPAGKKTGAASRARRPSSAADGSLGRAG